MTLKQLQTVAARMVTDCQRRLPVDLRSPAEAVPVCYESVPNEAVVEEGFEPDILGLFVGHPHLGDLDEAAPLPPQILLFVENIWDYAEGDENTFRDEIRLTYLHELGHYFGWDEDEVARRGLA
jgi:predicted Zn-dependent protease with MMP-like domain